MEVVTVLTNNVSVTLVGLVRDAINQIVLVFQTVLVVVIATLPIA